jgi:hypothetical protein|tara:strand:- start:1311 stop:1514 length:204 start_codon:yes stop_codon:yes gene_type:complete
MALNALNLQLVIKEYIVKMLNEAGVGMKCLVLDDFTVRNLSPFCPRHLPAPHTVVLTPIPPTIPTHS